MRRAVWGLICTGLVASGCGGFGLPSGRSDGGIELGEPVILDIDPDLASVGTQDLVVTIYGIDTFFDETVVVELPLLSDVIIVSEEAVGLERLEVVLSIPIDAELGTSPLIVTTDRDGTLSYDDGFTVVP